MMLLLHSWPISLTKFLVKATLVGSGKENMCKTAEKNPVCIGLLLSFHLFKKKTWDLLSCDCLSNFLSGIFYCQFVCSLTTPSFLTSYGLACKNKSIACPKWNDWIQLSASIGYGCLSYPEPGPHIRLPTPGRHKILTSLNWIQYNLKENSTS